MVDLMYYLTFASFSMFFSDGQIVMLELMLYTLRVFCELFSQFVLYEGNRWLKKKKPKHLFLTVLEAGNLKSGSHHSWVLADTFPGLETAFFSVSSCGRKQRKSGQALSYISSYKGSNYYFLVVPFLQTSHWGLNINI
jgi:hypothetical protein